MNPPFWIPMSWWTHILDSNELVNPPPWNPTHHPGFQPSTLDSNELVDPPPWIPMSWWTHHPGFQPTTLDSNPPPWIPMSWWTHHPGFQHLSIHLQQDSLDGCLITIIVHLKTELIKLCDLWLFRNDCEILYIYIFFMMLNCHGRGNIRGNQSNMDFPYTVRPP